ncbi:hypothetical protein Cni_G13522 [Canna indica]|uniref:Uncharacterized protein n=1 Tax=Canna indica TaxID=4628 RepID=A0AAQ3QDT8_9LILI|nr:hypothetical protein Cni_G13522 [Canna indica]
MLEPTSIWDDVEYKTKYGGAYCFSELFHDVGIRTRTRHESADYAYRHDSRMAADGSTPDREVSSILLHMNKEECVDTLFKHAYIKPVITSTVWTELEKENKEFFDAYAKNREKSVTEMKVIMQRAREINTPAEEEDDT